MSGPCAPCGPCGPADTSTSGSCAVWLVRMFSLLSKDARILLPELGTGAIPLLVNVPFSQACTVEVKFLAKPLRGS